MERINREALLPTRRRITDIPARRMPGEEVICGFRTERDGADAVYLIEYDKQDRIRW